MSQAPHFPNQPHFSDENSSAALHVLRDEDIPFVLPWMQDETAFSFHAFWSQTREQVTFLVAALADSQRIGLMMIYPHFLTVLNNSCQLTPAHFSIQVFFNYEIANRRELIGLLKKYIEYIFSTTPAETILWEVDNTELQLHIIAAGSGFTTMKNAGHPFTLYSYAR